jgi:C4-type Zn-finger protein
LMARCKSNEDLSASIMRVAQAALRISELWFTFRTRAVESAKDEVADFLSEKM